MFLAKYYMLFIHHTTKSELMEDMYHHFSI